ncbi:unnamed protein product [Arctogadus glacialis]
MKRGRNIERFFIKKNKPPVMTSATAVISSIPATESPSSQDTEPSVPGKMSSPGPSAMTLATEPEETTKSEMDPGPETQIKRPKMYAFRQDWLKQFPWLRYDKERNAMHCVYCQECGQNMAGNSAFVSGSTTFHIETLKEHNMSKKHTTCLDKCVEKVAPLPAAFQRQAAKIRSSEDRK